MTNDISPYVSPQFIKVYENVISHSFCDDLIQKFESNQDQWEKRDMSKGMIVVRRRQDSSEFKKLA